METTTFNHVVDRVLKANSLKEALDNNNDGEIESDYKKVIRLIHPDVCQHPQANDAIVRLNFFMDFYRNGKSYESDIGMIRYKRQSIHFDSARTSAIGKELLNKSRDNELIFISRTAIRDRKEFILRYMVSSSHIVNGSETDIMFNKDILPLVNSTYEEPHVRWILSRMLEYVAMLHSINFVHASMIPESIFLVPETHGIIVILFPHVTPKGDRMSTYSKWYKSWYPSHVFSNKIATEDIDIEMVKKTAVYLLGERSGNASLLKKRNITAPLIEFLLSYHNNSSEAYRDYRQMLDSNYEKKFYPLNYSL